MTTEPKTEPIIVTRRDPRRKCPQSLQSVTRCNETRSLDEKGRGVWERIPEAE